MACCSCKEEFACKNFGFKCSEKERNSFYEAEWGSNRIVFLLYRYFVAIYCIGWFAYSYATASSAPRGYQFFTRWNEFIVIMYFILACVVVTYGVVTRNRRETATEHASMKWMKGITWLFNSWALVGSVIVLVLYWGILAPGSTGNLGDPINIHIHVIVILLMIIDLFIVAFPIRILHAVYSMLLLFVYIFMTLVYHWSGVNSAVYSPLNWMNYPGLATGLSIAVIFLATSIVHLTVFEGYCLRRYIRSKFIESPNMVQPTKLNVVSNSEMAEKGYDNTGYADENVEKL